MLTDQECLNKGEANCPARGAQPGCVWILSENGELELCAWGKTSVVRTCDDYYAAMLARDHRFDGKFFIGVKTTGIYCRPICPAKPKRQNVEFFDNLLAAERAGYRPCQRCRPESAPLSPAWIGTSAVVQRAIKVLHRQDSITLNEEHFAEQFGVSARHLRRLFVSEIGKTPKQLCLENRLNLARKLIVETQLPMSQLAFAAGFRSIRRFNDAFQRRFEANPSAIRRHGSPQGGALRLSLAYRPPFDFAGLLNIYRAHQVGRLEWFEGDVMHRVIEFDGQIGTIAISDSPKQRCMWLEVDFPNTQHIHAIIHRVRAMFDLDSDPLVVANSFRVIRQLKPLIRRFPGIRIPSGWDPFETAVSAILGQLVSVEFGRRLVFDLVEMLGTDSDLTRDGAPIKLFPTPEVIASSTLDGLRTTGKRKQTLRTFAQRIAEKQLSLVPTQDIHAFTKAIRTIPGIGPWTASYIALKSLRHADAFPQTDLVLSRAVTHYTQEAIEQVSPWRGYAAALFWREHAQSPKGTGGKLK